MLALACFRVFNILEDEIEIDENFVKSFFLKVNTRKACGPDGLTGRVLKYCSGQLCLVFTRLFTLTPRDCVVPTHWKNVTICPVPKNNKPKSMNDYRLLALTSLQVFKRIVLRKLHLDQNQFVYINYKEALQMLLQLYNTLYSEVM